MSIRSMIKKGLRFLCDSGYRFRILASRGMYNDMPDDVYLKKLFKIVVGMELNLDNPQTFNEKLQWLKLHSRKDIYTVMVDKYLAKEYVSNIIGDEYIIPTIGVWDDPDEIDFASLPSQFVLKCNHNSGTGMCICKDKRTLDIAKVKADLRRGLAQNYYLHGREWPYKNVQRKIIAEKYMSEDGKEDLIDYKLMCFNGEVKCSFTCTDRFAEDGLKVTFYDRDWKMMPFERHYPALKVPEPKPANYEVMVELAETLSKGIPFVRVDLYLINGKVYFGELTLSPGNGMEEFTPVEWDYTLGSWIDLRHVDDHN